ncbi:hypothetical protein [Halobellus inordinatus]|uniref:hypothetical protein n=1 Tax=Halobellus inordinatus TaxID=1126236 RepID=UPI00210A9B88|nr:hypothetical protein [Halobellus inordinatus]
MLASSVSFVDSIAREIALWAGVLLLLASGLSFYVGWNERKRAEVIAETPRKPIAEVRSPGVIRIRGEIIPQVGQDTFTSPIKGDESCVLSAWEINEQYDTPKTKSWERAAWGIKTVPFFLSDDGGEILVDIDDVVVGNNTDDVFTPETLLSADGVSVEGLQCEFEAFDIHLETDYDESPPSRVTEFLDDTDGLSVDPMTTPAGEYVVDASKRKYAEQTLAPGDTISILGYAQPRRDGVESTTHPEDLVLTRTNESTLYLSELPFDGVSTGGGGLVFGLLTGVLGAVLLAFRVVA